MRKFAQAWGGGRFKAADVALKTDVQQSNEYQTQLPLP